MNRSSHDNTPEEAKKDDGTLERIAKAIDPPSTDVTDDEIMDPGANIRETPRRQEEINRKPPPQK